MPFRLIPKEKEDKLRESSRFVFAAPGGTQYIPDCWTEGVAVVVADTKTDEVVAYWDSNQYGGLWVFMDGEHCVAPYLFKRTSAAFKRMTKAGEQVELNPDNAPKRQARLAVWSAGHHRKLGKYLGISKPRAPGSPRQ